MKKIVPILVVALWIFLIIGEIKCIYKAVTCNWNPIGKSEVIYTAASLTGLGAIVGWINIKDE